MRIRIFGIFSETGIGTHAKNALRFLQKIQSSTFTVEHFSHNDPSQIQRAVDTSTAQDINLHLFPDAFAAQLKGLRLYWSVFESTRPPPGFLGWFNIFNYVLSASHWGRDCMVQYGAPAERITVIPEGVDPWAYHPYQERSPRQPTRFLMIGKYETRKGYEVALEAFAIAHAQNPQMELWLKPDWINGQQSQMHPAFLQLSRNYTHLPITLVHGMLSIEQMKQLYRDASYFLFPSLCEGWGLPLIEALASGVPTIACAHGGQSEFLNTIAGQYLYIPYTLAPITCPQWQQWYTHADGDWGQWAQIDPQVLAALMLQAAQSDYRAQAWEAAARIRKEFSWERSIDALLQFLFTTPALQSAVPPAAR